MNNCIYLYRLIHTQLKTFLKIIIEMRKQLFFVLAYLCMLLPSTAQVPYSANDTVAVYPGPFGFGSNMGYFPPWEDVDLAEFAAGNPTKGGDMILE